MKEFKVTRHVKFMSLFLSVLMLFSSLPIFANTPADTSSLDPSSVSDSTNNETNENVTKEDAAFTVSEDVSKREQYAKHFRMEDGTFVAAPMPIPYTISRTAYGRI